MRVTENREERRFQRYVDLITIPRFYLTVLFVSARMLLPPRPRTANDIFQLHKLWLPVQLSSYSVRTGHQHGRIAGPAWTFFNLNSLAGHFCGDCYNFPNAESSTTAEVVDESLWLCIAAQTIES